MLIMEVSVVADGHGYRFRVVPEDEATILVVYEEWILDRREWNESQRMTMSHDDALELAQALSMVVEHEKNHASS